MSPVKDLLRALDRVRDKQRKGSIGSKVIALVRPQDFEMIEKHVLGSLIHGDVTYFALTVTDSTRFHSCFFTPVTKSKENGSMIFVGDYEQLTRLLLSHPKIRHVEYAPEDHVIQAIFEDPYGERDLQVERYEQEVAEWEERKEGPGYPWQGRRARGGESYSSGGFDEMNKELNIIEELGKT